MVFPIGRHALDAAPERIAAEQLRVDIEKLSGQDVSIRPQGKVPQSCLGCWQALMKLEDLCENLKT